MKLIHSHLTGNQNVNHALYAFYKNNILKEFHVSLGTFSESLISKISRFGLFKEIKRREFNRDIRPFTRFHPAYEIGRVIMPRIGLRNSVSSPSGSFHIDNVVQQFDSAVARSLKNIKGKGKMAVYTYEDIALSTFIESKKLGFTCLYDLPIGYWRAARRLMDVEKNRRPEWMSTITGFADSEKKLQQKDEELILADRIFVASRFTAKTLQDFPGKLAPIEIIPYGFPDVSVRKREYSFNGSHDRPLKILFVGSLSQRKGIADLFDAVQYFGKHVQLTLVGQKPVHNNETLNEAVSKHKWYPSLPHSDVLALMRTHDVLIFPSLFEGFGLVITEAMAQGTPVITTDRTAGPDLIENNNNGWLIQAASTMALQQAIELILIRPFLINEVGLEALETAKKRPWSVYGYELAQAVSKMDRMI